LTEYEEILEREALALNLSHDKINKLMDALCALAEQHNLSTLWMPVLNDPDDEFLIHLTVEAKADYLVTHNVRHFAAAKQSGINLVAPWDFLAIIRT
jgi:predicted nucleic acid-binding protein